MPRVKRISAPGIVQHVMNRANRRATIFYQPADYEAFLALLLEAGRKFQVRLLAFCLMPNHWHLVLVAMEGGEISAYMRWLTGTHVRRYHRLYNLDGTGHLYQGRYTSVPVQSDGHLLVVIRYVEANPVRAGLVSRAENWPWSSLGATDSVRDQLVIDGPVPRPADWIEQVNEALSDLQRIRRSVAKGTPFGSPSWTAQTAGQHGLQFTMRSRGRPKKAGAGTASLNGGGRCR